MEVLLRVLVAAAFIAGCTGLVLRTGNRDRDVSWYPGPSAAGATRLLVVAALAVCDLFGITVEAAAHSTATLDHPGLSD